jgi:MSHA pilin protein MshD
MPRLTNRVKTAIRQQGFTLIEVIIGIVALSISLSIVATLLVPTEEQSAGQIHQIQAAELAQGLLDEISSRAFDQNSDMAGGVNRCNETGFVPCSAILGPESGELSRQDYNDVDDYHGYMLKETATGDGLAKGYTNFALGVTVVYDGLALGLADNQLAKRISVTVTTPLGTAITFSRYKANY